MELLKQYQADIMLLLSGICGIITLFIYMTNTISEKRKLALMQLEIYAMFLVIADRRAYIFRGDTSELGWWMVRISNFLVFILTLAVIYSFDLYLIDLFTHEGGLEKAPRRLRVVKWLTLAGILLVILSQFTGFYYTFDEMNRYQRAPGFIVCYMIPMIMMLLQMSVIVQYYKRLSRSMRTSLLLFTALSVAAAICQLFVYGVSLNNMTIVALSALLYIFALQDMSREVERARKREIEFYREKQEQSHALFEQTAEALAAAIDAKDEYTHGHSARVAMYSAQIAKEAGKSDEECDKIYFAALLHDVGKIGIADAIINKDGRLTDEEFNQIKLHPVYGNQILSTIRESPYLSIGAHFHHERYDGRGYPEGLKGEDIPDIARIIAVADAYDAMTSKRSYRDPIPQQTVREELVKGMGTQFDPQYAKIMLHLIDLDTEYHMRERETGPDDAFSTRLRCERIYHDCTVGIPVNDKRMRLTFYCKPDEGYSAAESLPTLILFDALDARVHEEEDKRKALLYFEYGQIKFGSQPLCEEARRMETHTSHVKQHKKSIQSRAHSHFVSYTVEAVRVRDHALIRFSDGETSTETVVALPDSVRFSYLSLTGEHCIISNIRTEREESSASTDSIPRIAEEVSYIEGCPEGDIPNVQIDGWRTPTSKSIPLKTGLTLRFHTRSLPMARLVWHCPFVSVFTSADGESEGEGYREFLLLRLDGESWESDDHAENEVQINHTRDFAGWNAWKEQNKQGFDCTVVIHRDGNLVTVETENLGIAIRSRTTIRDEVGALYVALTGDECALTDIHFSEETA